ncbi:polysaccharide pyruvyl transferase family protein [Kocuria sp. LUK]|uniref:polysaccharide pyruvyl transferase family protein n=1 Tax=Kocuria sp. LUK TaxID=2897828 RepID=UPI0035ADDA28
MIWGTGVNGKFLPPKNRIDRLDIRSVRGPLTANFLRQHGVSTPSIFGDPGLLIPRLFPEVASWASVKNSQYLLIPNLNDYKTWFGGARSANVLNPTSDVWHCIRSIAASELIIASSLHALVLADALGIPTIPVSSLSEPPFKYRDYYEGTGRKMPDFASSLREAFSMSPVDPPCSLPLESIVSAFPWDLWGGGR